MKWLFGTLFLNSRIQNHPDTIILQNYQSLSNQSFKHNSAHLLSLYLTLTLSFEPSFCMFIINGYYAESKHTCCPWTPSFGYFNRKRRLLQIWPKKLKLSWKTEMWLLDTLEYAELDGNIQIYCVFLLNWNAHFG